MSRQSLSASAQVERICYVGGEFVPEANASVSVFDRDEPGHGDGGEP